MTTLALINDEAISAADMKTLAKALKNFCDRVTTAWNLQPVTVVTTPTPGAWVIHLTEAKRAQGALGYHTVESSLPVAYVSLKAVSSKLWGIFYPARFFKKMQISPAIYLQGLITVICHEVAEMLCDPAISTVSAKDSQERQWLVEVCDHCYGSFATITVDGKVCVLPDVTTPAFYDLHAKGPYTIFDSVKAPFTMTPKGYGYYKNATGALVKI